MTAPLSRPVPRPFSLSTASPTTASPTAAPARTRGPVVGQAAKFLLVGGAATVIDIGLFNLLHAVLGVGPLTAKVLSTLVAGVAAFIGNRQWSFAAGRGQVRRQAFAFLVVNLVSLALALLPLAVARYALGMTGVVALNVAGNVVGLTLATALRFYGYRRWVFPTAPAAASGPVAGSADDVEELAA